MSATTITTIEDLVRLLDEKPEWLEALRTRPLTRELLELPQQLAEFAATTNQQGVPELSDPHTLEVD